MSIKQPELIEKFQSFLTFIKRYAVFIFVTAMFLILAFFVFRINQYSSVEPSESDFNNKLKTVQRPKIDQSVIDRIQQLKSQNIQVQSLYDQARENPFSE